MANRFIEQMLPQPPVPVEQMAPGPLAEYLEALELVAASGGFLADVARSKLGDVRRATTSIDITIGGIDGQPVVSPEAQ
jgi:hypothetical protein